MAQALLSMPSMSVEVNGKTFSKEFHDFAERTNSLRSCDGTRPLVIFLDVFWSTFKRDSSSIKAILTT
jgi:hypothetical protein